jgi:hypothetical protein
MMVLRACPDTSDSFSKIVGGPSCHIFKTLGPFSRHFSLICFVAYTVWFNLHSLSESMRLYGLTYPTLHGQRGKGGLVYA